MKINYFPLALPLLLLVACSEQPNSKKLSTESIDGIPIISSQEGYPVGTKEDKPLEKIEDVAIISSQAGYPVKTGEPFPEKTEGQTKINATHHSADSQSTKEKQSQDAPITTTKSLANTILTKNQRFMGFYTYGHETNTFTPCQTDKVYWVEADIKIIEQLENGYRKRIKKAYDQVFVDISGRYLGKATDGFAEDSDGLFRIERIHTLRNRDIDDCKKTKESESTS